MTSFGPIPAAFLPRPAMLRPAMLRAAVLLAPLVLTTGTHRLRAADDPRPTTATVIARIGNLPIYRSELDIALRRAGADQIRSPEQSLRLEAEALEQLVNERLLKKVIEAEKIEVDADEVSTVMVRMRSELTDRKIPFEAFLAQSGRDEQSLRSQIELELALNKLLTPQLTSDALAAMFAKYRRELDGTRVRASHIVLRPDPARGADAVPEMMRRATAIRRQILQGTITFAEAAKKYSVGPSRRQGGDVGYFPRNGGLNEDFAREAFALAKGELSKPFVTPFGVHVVVVTGIEPGNVTAGSLRPQLEKLVVQQAIRGLLENGRKSTPVTYAPGVAHFDGPPPATADSGQLKQRPIVVATPAEAAASAGE